MIDGSGGSRTLSISRSKREWSAHCLPSRKRPESRSHYPGWESNPQAPGFKPGRSAGWRTWASRGGSRGTRTHERPEAATCFQDRPLIRPDGFREGFRPELRGLESNQRPPRSERGVTTSSNCPGVREGGLEPPPPDSKSGSLPVSRFPRAPRGSRTRLSDLASPRLTARPGTHQRSLRVRDRGVEPRSPGWKPGVVPLEQSRIEQAEGEGVEPPRLIARPDHRCAAVPRAGCRRQSACPSVSSCGGRNRTCDGAVNSRLPVPARVPPQSSQRGRI